MDSVNYLLAVDSVYTIVFDTGSERFRKLANHPHPIVRLRTPNFLPTTDAALCGLRHHKDPCLRMLARNLLSKAKGKLPLMANQSYQLPLRE